MKRTLSFTLNGAPSRIDIDPSACLLDLLRGPLGLNGPKYGCGKAQCGACTVLVDDVPARACVLTPQQIAGRHVTTLEGLADPEGTLSALQQGFLEMEGAQCGYCLNGMVMTAAGFLKRNPAPSAEEVRQALRHNLCRCGSHKEIIASVLRAAELMAEQNAGQNAGQADG